MERVNNGKNLTSNTLVVQERGEIQIYSEVTISTHSLV